MDADKKGSRAAVYSRKSRFTGRGESIENQVELCLRYLQEHGGGTDGVLIYEDEGFSGGSLDRPQFRKMMKDARAGEFSSLVCYRLDRISRNIGDFARLIEELNRLHISFVSVREQFDTSSPMGRAMMYIASVFSQLERETIAERIRDNMLELAKTGRWLGGTTPTGYASEAVRSVTADGKARKSCKLKLVPEEAEIVRLIFRKFSELNSLTKTETFLMQNGVKTRKGNWFSRFSIRNILENPVYMITDSDAYRCLKESGAEIFAGEKDFDGRHGIMAYNKTTQTGKGKQARDKSDWIVTTGKHPGIVTGAQWSEAQRLLEQNRSKAFRKPRSGVALLSGLLRCSCCGSFMRPKLTRRLGANGEPVYTYLCEMKERSRGQNCSMKNVCGNDLDQAICDEVKKLPEDSESFLALLDKEYRSAESLPSESDAEAERLHKALLENERDVSALITALAEAGNTPAREDILHRINELHEKGNEVRAQLDKVENTNRIHTLSAPEYSAVVRRMSSFPEMFDAMTAEQKRAALRGLLEKVVWDGETAHVYLCGKEPLCDRRK